MIYSAVRDQTTKQKMHFCTALVFLTLVVNFKCFVFLCALKTCWGPLYSLWFKCTAAGLVIWSWKAGMRTMNRKENGSLGVDVKSNQSNCNFCFVHSGLARKKNAAPDNLNYGSNLSLYSLSSHSHPLVFLPFTFFCPFSTLSSPPPSVFAHGLFGWRQEGSCASWTAEAKRRKSLGRQRELHSYVGFTSAAQDGGADPAQVGCVCTDAYIWEWIKWSAALDCCSWFIIQKMGDFDCRAEDLQCVSDRFWNALFWMVWTVLKCVSCLP